MLYRFGMSRVLLLGFVVLTVACGEKTFGSLCAAQVPAPAECNTPCDPAPGATTSCPSGFHCASSGKCDLQCTVGGTQCGDGYSCSSDGYCKNTGGSGSGTGGDDQPPDQDACPAVHVTATKVIPSIQLLIDRSGSMLHNFNDDAPAPGDQVKFPTEKDALVGAQGVVTQLQDSVYFGASMYPGPACPGVFAVGRALNNKMAIQTLLEAHAPDPKANTPTAVSIDEVVKDFTNNPPPAGSPPVIVLATDGLPNSCDGTGDMAQQTTKASAAAAFQKGIKLYLLVVGTKIDADFKRQLANVGQGIGEDVTPGAKAFTATNATELSSAFQEIIGGVLSCDLRLNHELNPDNVQNGDVKLNGTHLLYGEEWTVDNDNITLHLLGRACATLKSSTSPMVDATFPCGTVIF
jgi:hypothetical protein